MLEILFGWRKASRCKDVIRNVRRHLKLLRNKRDNVVRHLRNDIAHLLKDGHAEIALDRVEQLYKDQSTLAAYDLLDHFCEFIIFQLPYIRRHRDLPDGINEAVSTLIFAAARCGDLPELQILRKLFGERYGKDFALAAVELIPGSHVNLQISKSLCVKEISDDTKVTLIEEIARENSLQVGHLHIEDGCKLQNLQFQVPTPLRTSDCEWERDASEMDIQVVYSDKGVAFDTGSQVEKLNKLDTSYSSAMVLDRPYEQSNRGITSPSRSGTASMQHKVERITERTISESSTQFLEEDIIYPNDEAKNLFPTTQADGEGEDGRWFMLKSTKLGSKCRKRHEKNHGSEIKLPQSNIVIRIAGSWGEGKWTYGRHSCKSSSRGSRDHLSDLNHCNYDDNHVEFRDFLDGRVNCRHSNKRRKSIGQRSKKGSVSRQSQAYSSCGANHDSGDCMRKNRSFSQKIHNRRNCTSMTVALSLMDEEFAWYSDNTSDCSGLNSPRYQWKAKDHQSSLSNSQSSYANSRIPHRKQHKMEVSTEESRTCSSRVHKKKPLLPNYAQKTPTEHSYLESEGSNTPHKCNCNRRSYNSCSWNQNTAHECCLEHPCYFVACIDQDHWESPSLKRLGGGRIPEGLQSCDLRKEEEKKDYILCHYPPNESALNCNTVTLHVTCTIPASDKTMNTKPTNNRREQQTTWDSSPSKKFTDLNSDMDSHKNYGPRRRNREAEREGISDCFHRNEREILPWAQPPYLKAMGTPTERPKISSMAQTSNYASFQTQQSNQSSSSSRHIHPKLPDYDDLAAKFKALKREHLQRMAAQRQPCS
ncbi:uncharacterized protein LOC143884185 [Tasmannia lanceolata]|uniref:uncharacterized protein LOC143884185 n=1 Tax=Tasmannia lanceolata TaxID=3420 RepID=UPI004062B46C